ncbi:MAG: Protein of unknown function (DUF938) [Rhodobacteraceae bacterium HLUCCA12]|nr:MAG: Protein of unknown function (DUF938) [Rhodobacteraceae bacterium HLUCCA12]
MRHLNLPDNSAPIDGARRRAPSAERNLEPIAAVLEQHLPKSGRVLELASGTGQHIVALAARFGGLTWQPTDIDPANLESIRAWVAEVGPDNVRPPLHLDACEPGWADTQANWDVICLTNLLHLISATEAETLLTEVARALSPGGLFCLYGPFRRDGALTSDGDKRFDANLRAQDPAIGYKDFEWVEQVLAECGLSPRALHTMPANNLMIVTRRPDQA